MQTLNTKNILLNIVKMIITKTLSNALTYIKFLSSMVNMLFGNLHFLLKYYK